MSSRLLFYQVYLQEVFSVRHKDAAIEHGEVEVSTNSLGALCESSSGMRKSRRMDRGSNFAWEHASIPTRRIKVEGTWVQMTKIAKRNEALADRRSTCSKFVQASI